MKKSIPFSIEMLTTYKENSKLEVKSAKGGLPYSLWETYSAFANSDGGVIVIGVKESKDGSFQIEGINDVHKLLRDFWNMVNNRQKVSSNILIDSMVYPDNVEGKNVIVINVPRAERTSRPIYVGTDPRSGTYRRNYEGDYHCSLEEVSLMIRDSALVTDDNKLITEYDVKAFCPETVNAYRNIFRLVRPNHLWNNEDDAIFLRRIGAIREDRSTGKFHPTIAGLLMFGYESDITSIFSNYFLDYQENRTNGIYARWTDRITSQSGDWSGNVFDFMLKIIPKLQADLKVPFMLKGDMRDEDTPLHKVLREATVNMLANADFYGRRGIVVQKGVDGFKFANPGCMRVSLREVLQDNASDPRNGVMMKMLALVEYGERAGSGLQGIFKIWETVFHCSPILEVSTSDGIDRTTLSLDFKGHNPDVEAMKRLYNHTREVIYTPNSTQENHNSTQENHNSTQENHNSTQENHNSTQENHNSIQENHNSTQERHNSTQENHNSTQENHNSTQENHIGIQEDYDNNRENNKSRVISILEKCPSMTLMDVSKQLGITRDGVKKIIAKLKDDGILTREGSTKAGRWIINKKS